MDKNNQQKNANRTSIKYTRKYYCTIKIYIDKLDNIDFPN